MKASIESCSEALAKLFNDIILTSDFPGKLKVADVSLSFKRDDHKNQIITDLAVFCL